MKTLKITGQFKKDLKRYKHQADKIDALEEILKKLRAGEEIPSDFNPHPLTENYKGHMECHVKGDLLLIWLVRILISSILSVLGAIPNYSDTHFKPHRKNPHIANVFSQTIMVEELGSGTKRNFKYTPLYANGQFPEIYEDDYFTIVIPTRFAISDTNSDTINRDNDTNSDTNKLTPADVIMRLIKENPVISAAQMSKVLGINRRNTLVHLKKLQEAGRIIRVGTNKAGHWEVVKP